MKKSDSIVIETRVPFSIGFMLKCLAQYLGFLFLTLALFVPIIAIAAVILFAIVRSIFGG